MKKQSLGLMLILLSAWLLSGCSQGANNAGPVNLNRSVLPLSVTLLPGNSAQLQWNETNAQVSYYDLEVLGDNGYSNLVRIPAGKAGFVDTGLMQNVTYSYTLKAYDQYNVLLNTYSTSARINVFSTTNSDTVL